MGPPRLRQGSDGQTVVVRTDVDPPAVETLRAVEDVFAESDRATVRVPVGPLRVFTREIEVHEAVTWPWHRHVESELLWAVEPMLTVITEVGTFVVPAPLSLWLPAGIAHEVSAPANARLRCSWLRLPAGRRPGFGELPVAVHITPLLAAVLEHLDDRELTRGERRRGEDFAFDLLTAARRAPVAVTLPTSSTVRAVALAVLEDPATAPSLEAASRSVSMSVRGFSRRFSAEAGMSFGQWITRVRVQHACALLADGVPVAVVGRRVGYRSSSAFAAAFVRVTGLTPSAFATAA